MEILETYSVIITFYDNTTIFKIALLNELSDCKKPNYQPPLSPPLHTPLPIPLSPDLKTTLSLYYM